MKIGDMIESRYLKQSDVPDPVIATIVALKKVNVARDDEEADYRWTIRFAEWPKPMVCNVTNLKRLAKALGDDSDNWLNQKIEVYTDPDIEFGGNIVGGLRVRGLKRAPGSLIRNNDDDANRKFREAATDYDPNEIPF